MATDKNNVAPNQPANDTTPSGSTPPKNNKPSRYKVPKWVYPVAAAGGLAGGFILEAHTSYVQSRVFPSIARGERFTKTKQADEKTAPPAAGPYDERLGYTKTLDFHQRLTQAGYQSNPVEVKWNEHDIMGIKLYPIYNRKATAGLEILDDQDTSLYNANFPRQAYQSFDDIPPIVVNSLLFVENRELNHGHTEFWNPAIDWGRFVYAIMGWGMKKVHLGGGASAGGSTLATQIEKFQHSPEGITGSPVEKLRQMLTASVRAYEDGSSTVESRRDIVLEYLNAMPLSAYPGIGEINGFSDGMNAWFGADMKQVNNLLKKDQNDLTEDELKQAGKIYRQSLSLIMAVKKPSAYLLKDRQELQDRIDKFLPLLVENGILTPRMKDAVLAAKPEFADPATRVKPAKNPTRKSVTSLQTDLMKALQVGGIYELSRLDLTARTTVDAQADEAVTRTLRSLANPDVAQANGLTGFQLLRPEQAPDVIYSFTLYEKLPDGTNVLRVQTDNFDGPLNLNEGTKLELGSTAKLRTLVSYLEAFSDLHKKYADQDPETLRAIQVNPNDNITRWALDYLADPATDKSLNAMLEASLERKYSGSPYEGFFTGGGLHYFENFDRIEDHQNYNVKDAFHHSVNLSFIRMMRDLVSYSITNKMNIAPDIYDNPDSPQRAEYLKKFADTEGTSYLWRYWVQQRGKSADEIDAILADDTKRTPHQLAVVYRTIHPQEPIEKMAEYIRRECANCGDNVDFEKMYNAYAPGKFDLNDLGYLAKVHPLALWLGAYRIENPQATWNDAVKASADERITTYEWLLESNKFRAQNIRIRTVLEKEAFTHIHATWKALGFPFDKMVASYASSIGSSGDTPAALAELSGIIQNDGLKTQKIKFSDIEFGANTPYYRSFKPKADNPQRVLPAELTRLVRREMQGVVEQGTARRANQSVKLSDGRILPVGGKTGTGDQSFAINPGSKTRTATFVYAIDDRFYGCVTAFVRGAEDMSEADFKKYKFTSAIAAQTFKVVIPQIRPLLDRAYGVTPAPSASAAPPTTTAPAPAPAPAASTPTVPTTRVKIVPPKPAA